MKKPENALEGTAAGKNALRPALAGPPLKIGRLTVQRDMLLLVAILLVGCFVRLFGLSTMVTGVNGDEASIGYDAFGIATYGMDRNLVHNPAYLIAWGSGQNAGYAWLLVPFIKLFGLNLLTLRLPMALAGCLSLWAFYTIFRRGGDNRLALLGVFLLAISPWHILKSRWALESNLFPEMLLWGAALLCAGIGSGKKRWYYLSCIVWGLATWAYATSFVMLPLFLLPVALVLWRKKLLSLPHLAGCFAAFLAVSWPIILFSIVNFLELPPIQLPFLTIPRLVAMREGELALMSANPLGQLARNAKLLVSMGLAQDDGMSWSVVQGFGLIYLFSLPFAVAGFLRLVLPEKWGGKYRQLVPGGWVFLPMLGAALVSSLMIEPNVNRSNALWFPLIWYWVVGVWDVVSLDGFWKRFLPALYAVFFLLFCNTAIKVQNDRFNTAFDSGFQQAVRYADETGKPVYVSGASPPYIKILFELQPSPVDFQNSILYEEKGAFGNVFQWDKWTVAEPDSPDVSDDYVIIVRDGRQGPYLEAGWRMVRFDYFWVGVAP